MASGEGFLSGILSCIVLIVPVLYFLRWDYRAIFQKPTLKEIGLAVALFIGYLIYAVIVGEAISYIGITSPGIVDESAVTIMTTLPLIFSLMGEEFVKFIPFMFFLRLAYKYSNNRKLAIVISMGLVMIMFAAMHAFTFNMFLYALFIQGLGSIFEFYGYIKTKNIFVSYITHLCTDMFIMSLTLLGL